MYVVVALFDHAIKQAYGFERGSTSHIIPKDFVECTETFVAGLESLSGLAKVK